MDPPGGAPANGEVTDLLLAWQGGDRTALDRLVPLVYSQLHRIAAARLRDERPGHTLQPSAIVHETYLKLVGRSHGRWESRTQFFAVASRSMREILVDYARRRAAQKRADPRESRLDTEAMVLPRGADIIAVDDALEKLAALDREQARIVELRFFGGLTVEEAADALDVSAATVERKWRAARAWLHRELSRTP